MVNKTPAKPQTLKGFNDWFAEDVKIREKVIDTLKKGFEKYGYEPLETPALEYSKFMLGQSGKEAEKQYYRFQDPGGRDVMLKYEVMISMCRAVASNIDKIPLPFKRYQIQPVWRAENTQKGRLRQFTQADADTIGSPSMLADAEFIQMGLEITQNLGFKKFVARVSNRKFLDGLREYLDIPNENFYGLCMSIDKLSKIGRRKTEKELVEKRGLDSRKASAILNLIGPGQYLSLSNDQIIDRFASTIGKIKIGGQGLSELKEIFNYLKMTKVDSRLYRFDPTIARGLASYTGPIWEFEVIDGGVGSICGAGRYDKAIGKYLGAGKQVPATGGSFGIERICQILKDRQMVKLNPANATVLVTTFSRELKRASIKTANKLRKEGVSTDLYLNPEEKLPKQLKYGSNKKIPWVIIIGPDEVKQNQLVLKSLETGKQESLTLAQTIKKIAAHESS